MKKYFNCEMAEKLCEMIHGSGLDSKPEILEWPRFDIITWDYHLMNDGGYYDGYWYFTIRIPRKDPLNYKVHGRRGNTRKFSAWGIKEVIEEQVEFAMQQVLKDAGVEVTRVVEKVYPYDKQGEPNPEFNPKYSAYAAIHGYHYGRVHYEYEGALVEEEEYDFL